MTHEIRPRAGPENHHVLKKASPDGRSGPFGEKNKERFWGSLEARKSVGLSPTFAIRVPSRREIVTAPNHPA
jgi:hypothetical protein